MTGYKLGSMNQTPAPRSLPPSIDATLDLLASADYLADRSLATVLFLALQDEPPAVSRGRGRGRQDRDRQGALVDARAPPHPPAMLRRARRLGGGLRVELCRADDRDPRRRGGRQPRPRAARARRVLRALSDQASAVAGARARSGGRAGAADRRARPRRRSVRGFSPGGARGLPGDHPGTRHREDANIRRSW